MPQAPVRLVHGNQKSGLIDYNSQDIYFAIHDLPNQEMVAVGTLLEFDIVKGEHQGKPQQRAKKIRLVAEVPSQPEQEVATPTRPSPATHPQRTRREERSVPPYHFVPQWKEAITRTPIWHDGSNPSSSELLSGELQITLTALTPLLVGNYHYPCQQVSGARKENNTVILPEEWNLPPMMVDKTVIEPLRLADGRVVISGSGIKGMLRHSLAALMGAPMERVAERVYGYRPNLAHGSDKKVKMAIIQKRNSDDSLDVLILDASRDFKFHREQPEQLRHLQREGKKVVRYWGGIDGVENPKQRCAISYPTHTGGKSLTISKEVVQHYFQTLDFLTDTHSGHYSSRHPDCTNIQRNRHKEHLQQLKRDLFHPNTAIYVEYDQPTQTVTSMGHHYHYLTRYQDSVLYKGYGENQVLRPEVTPHADEQNQNAEGAPLALTLARLLFGYTSGEKEATPPPLQGIGKGDFQHLAGRVAINMAVERIEPPRERFLNPNHGCCVTLRTLGQPRPSAVEFYLQQSPTAQRQDGGTLTTYGDLPSIDDGGDLNGRKFYLHQPDAATHPRCYTAQEGSEEIGDKLATIGRFISRPGQQFRFTLRFRDLRDWELGLIALVLQPEQLFEALKREQRVQVQEYAQQLRELPATERSRPLFAHKLGYGRPLGLGSIQLTLDRALVGKELHEFDLSPCRQRAIEEFGHFWQDNNTSLLDWFRIHQYRGRSRYDYPRDQKGTIHGFHFDLRKKHAKGRRQPAPAVPERRALKPL